MKGELKRWPDAGSGQSMGTLSIRQTGHRGGRDRRAFVSAEQNYERYSALARKASSRGDRVAMENFYQHAEHYFRVMRVASACDE